MLQRGIVLVRGLLPVVVLAFTLFAGEAALRLYHWVWLGIPPIAGKPTTSLTPDGFLGWRPTENFRRVTTEKTAKGTEYVVNNSFNELGFRMFGDRNSGKPRVLVIGDSFTQAMPVSDDKTYYFILKEYFDIEVFAYGADGYGTLQEYMVLDNYFDRINPDVVLWQFCPNDFLDNSPELEKASLINNAGKRRPYWVEGKVVYISVAREAMVIIREWAGAHSRLLSAMIHRLDKLLASRAKKSVEEEIQQQGLKHHGFLMAVQTTDELIGKVKKRVGKVPIVGFVCRGYQPYLDALKEISLHHGFIFIDEVAESIEAAVERGEDVLHSDRGHWNEAGHRLAARAIANRIKKMPALMRVRLHKVPSLARRQSPRFGKLDNFMIIGKIRHCNEALEAGSQSMGTT
jgi:hypothetical protein